MSRRRARAKHHHIETSVSSMTIQSVSEIFVGSVSEGLDKLLPQHRVVVIADATIDRLYHDLISRYDNIIIGQGEANKGLDTVLSIYSRLMELGADRSTFLLGVGGGIVTDITGFVASTFMRGLDFGFVSTTLLGQVDASIGGKNGVNIHGYKNMAGTFAHPRFIIANVDMLRTLPRREQRAGMAEVVKAAVIGDAALFEMLEANVSEDIYSKRDIMQEIVLRSMRLKLDIVERDDKERGLRRILNLGHTIGHAIEKCRRDVNHGEGVAIGLSLMAHAAVKRGIMAAEDAERIDSLLSTLGFTLIPPVSMTEITRVVRYDKKKQNNILCIVLPEGIGRCRIEEIEIDEFETLFA